MAEIIFITIFCRTVFSEIFFSVCDYYLMETCVILKFYRRTLISKVQVIYRRFSFRNRRIQEDQKRPRIDLFKKYFWLKYFARSFKLYLFVTPDVFAVPESNKRPLATSMPLLIASVYSHSHQHDIVTPRVHLDTSRVYNL